MKVYILCLLMLCSLKSYCAERILYENLQGNDLYQELLKEEFMGEIKLWFKGMIVKAHEDSDSLLNLHNQAQVIFAKVIRSCERQEIGLKRKEISDMSSVFSSISAQAGEMHNVIKSPEQYHFEWMKKMPTQKMNIALTRLFGSEEAEEFLFAE